jgi:hypothetical protein
MTYVEPEYFLNEYFSSDMPLSEAITSSPANYEVPVHVFSFNVPDACKAFLNVHAPLATYHYQPTTVSVLSTPSNPTISFPFFNGACRVYHNGDDWTVFPTAKQWNSPGGASVGAGQWNFGWAAPANGLLDGTREINLTAGTNTIRVHLATNSPLESIRLMGPRWFQVYRLKTVS